MPKYNLSYKRVVLGCFFVFVFVIAGFLPPDASASSGLADDGIPGAPKTICFTSLPRLENFPDIALDFRVLDSRNTTVSGVSSTDIQAQENNSASVPTTINVAPVGVGLNIYFVIDMSNRTDLTLVSDTLKSIVPLLKDNLDEVTIISDGNQGANYLLKTTRSLSDFQKAIQNLPSSSGAYSTINVAIQQALKDIKSQNYGCLHPNLVIVMSGGNALNYANTTGNFQSYIDNANEIWTSLNFFNYPNFRHMFTAEPTFEKLASGTNGLYRQILNGANINESLPMLGVDRQRDQYTATYRSIKGDSGDRTISLLYQNRDITRQAPTYSITILAPEVAIINPADGAVLPVPGSNSDLASVAISVTWPDGHKRNLASESLIVSSSDGGTEPKMNMNVTGEPQNFDWNINEYRGDEENALQIQVKVIDEFGLTSTSQPVGVKISIIPPIDITKTVTPSWTVYLLYGIVALLVVVLIIMGRKLAKVGSGVVRKAVEGVTQFIVGKRKGKPLASIKVIEGPATMIGTELPVYSESVKLGRESDKSDYTFYSGFNTSVSGLHCLLERKKGIWKITAQSLSKSETYVDDQAIPFFEPYPLKDGQTVRMGNHGLLPVIFQFKIIDSPFEEGLSEDSNKTQYDSAADEDSANITQVPGNLTDEELKKADNIFAEYREEDKE